MTPTTTTTSFTKNDYILHRELCEQVSESEKSWGVKVQNDATGRREVIYLPKSRCQKTAAGYLVPAWLAKKLAPVHAKISVIDGLQRLCVANVNF